MVIDSCEMGQVPLGISFSKQFLHSDLPGMFRSESKFKCEISLDQELYDSNAQNVLTNLIYCDDL